MLEQAGNRVVTSSMASVCKLLAEQAQGTSDPLLLGHGVTRYLVCEQPLQCWDDCWIYLFYQLASPAGPTYSVLLPAVRSADARSRPGRVRFPRTFEPVGDLLYAFDRLSWFLLPQLGYPFENRRSR